MQPTAFRSPRRARSKVRTEVARVPVPCGSPSRVVYAEPAHAAPAEAPVRADLIARVRAQIAAGEYDTPERWDATLDRLADSLLG